MKKLFIGFTVLALTLTSGLSVMARPNHNNNDNYNKPGYQNSPNYNRNQNNNRNQANAQQARMVLERTAQELQEAQQAARRGGRIDGLSIAINDQQHAQQLYRAGNYDEAINYSLRARELAENICRNNDTHYRPKNWDNFEHDHYQQAPPKNQLDIRIKGSDDHTALSFKINLNF